MADVRLPITATPAELVEGIERAQARCHRHLLDPTATVTDIIIQLGRVNDMAAAAGLLFQEFRPHAEWFPHGAYNVVTTIVTLGSHSYWIRRGTPSRTVTPGLVSLSLWPPTEAPRG